MRSLLFVALAGCTADPPDDAPKDATTPTDTPSTTDSEPPTDTDGTTTDTGPGTTADTTDTGTPGTTDPYTGVCVAGLPASPAATSGVLPTGPVTHSTTIRPAAAFSDGGEYAIAWTDGASHAVFVQRFLAGVATGPEVQVSPNNPVVTAAPAVAMNAAGDLVVAWIDATDFGVHYQVYDALGAPIVAATASNAGAFVTQSPSVALDDARNVVAAWTDVGNVFGAVVQIVDPAGVPLLAPPALASGVGQFVTEQPAVAIDASGDFVVAYASSDGNFSAFVRRFDSAGNPIGMPVAASRSTTS
jgi:hypothetical protein